ncbi:MAG: DUF2066 domain-containing protein [Wenzhouxiangellaceae bacterium]|nr:DUF2066 domain-containing protein [Wenzhouxiangellaceae bacterium]
MAGARFIALFLVLAGWLSILPAGASLYVGEADIEPTGKSARPPILDALNQVLVRLTGRADEDLVAKLGIDSAQANSLSLGRQFRSASVIGPDGDAFEQRRLRVDFDPAAVNDLLERADLPRWGGERPELLLWIVDDGPRGARYLGDDAVIDHALDRASFRYGFEFARPILDASDRIEVTPADIRGGFTSAAADAVRRYGADGVVMLDLRQSDAYWTGRWAWRINDFESTFERSGSNPQEVIELGLGRIAGALAARFAVRSDAPVLRRLVVSGVSSVNHYTEVSGFLRRLTGVDQVRLLAADGQSLTFELRTSADGLRQRIELTGPLQFERHDLSAGTLYYRLAW